MNKLYILILLFCIPLVNALTLTIEYEEPTPPNNSITFSDTAFIKANINIRPYECVLMVGRDNYFYNYSMFVQDFSCIYTLVLRDKTAYNFSVFAFDTQGNSNSGETRIFHSGNVTVLKSEIPYSTDAFLNIGNIIWEHNPVVGWIVFILGIYLIIMAVNMVSSKSFRGGN